MPLPALIGIPLLISTIGSFIAGIFAFVVSLASKEILLRLAVLAFCATATTAFFAAILSASNALVSATPPQLSMALSWVIPSNFSICLSTICGAHVTRWVYDWTISKALLRV